MFSFITDLSLMSPPLEKSQNCHPTEAWSLDFLQGGMIQQGDGPEVLVSGLGGITLPPRSTSCNWMELISGSCK